MSAEFLRHGVAAGGSSRCRTMALPTIRGGGASVAAVSGGTIPDDVRPDGSPEGSGRVLLDALPAVRADRAGRFSSVCGRWAGAGIVGTSRTDGDESGRRHLRRVRRLAPPGRPHVVCLDDVVVMPSLWPEPFGLVGLEANRRGVPVVAFATGGIPEWLHDGVNGCLAPGDPPTADGLADALIRCIRSLESSDALIRRACGGPFEARRPAPRRPARDPRGAARRADRVSA